eukprot:gnl/MRDRNA2_/MRDRNA2_179327_c0_seq1.p1 gnl/MRDRNA2_/MRDRNA2_179327_c0~~gnl/MRDRNA2_/MRDRNA2_179327_c0_seq1.p1  ORF type:complete len:351 (+),score=69.23 gnl/MRDRNA2_/MRDRNA2_179327_c0_seq1:121-1173(+)
MPRLCKSVACTYKLPVHFFTVCSFCLVVCLGGNVLSGPWSGWHQQGTTTLASGDVSGISLSGGQPFTAYATSEDGEPGTASYRVRFTDESNQYISPWHDIPLNAGDGIFNAVFEIPKMTRPKMEVATKEAENPIAQDVKKEKLREYHGPIFWNYGMFPQTWEDPSVEDPGTNCKGDNDPLDVVEIGSAALARGKVTAVKPLGALAMIDEGELDWKVIAVNVEDPLAQTLNDINDVPEHVVSGIREWFRWYKTPDGKPLNRFGNEEKAFNKAQTLEVIAETHKAWKRLMNGETEHGKLWVKSRPAHASNQLFYQSSTDVTNILAVVLISMCVGFNFCRNAPTTGKEALLSV